MSESFGDQIAQAFGFKDLSELEGLHEAAFPGYDEARQQADAEMAATETRVLDYAEHLAQYLNNKLEGTGMSVEFNHESIMRRDSGD
jgi:hypothetical protein